MSGTSTTLPRWVLALLCSTIIASDSHRDAERRAARLRALTRLSPVAFAYFLRHESTCYAHPIRDFVVFYIAGVDGWKVSHDSVLNCAGITEVPEKERDDALSYVCGIFTRAAQLMHDHSQLLDELQAINSGGCRTHEEDGQRQGWRRMGEAITELRLVSSSRTQLDTNYLVARHWNRHIRPTLS